MHKKTRTIFLIQLEDEYADEEKKESGESRKKKKMKEKLAENKSAVEHYRDGYDYDVKQKRKDLAFPHYELSAKTDPKYANAYFGMASC